MFDFYNITERYNALPIQNMKFDPRIHHRHSIRLQGYDYALAGGYYATLVTEGRECLFGQIDKDEMILNDAGEMVGKWWNELPHKFPSITVDMFVVMPNHFHGIVILHDESVGADLRVCPGNDEIKIGTEKGAHTGAPLQRTSLSQIVQWFKTMTTNEYMRGVKQSGWRTFNGKLWQRNYYEHIIRNQSDWERIAAYILANPSQWANDEENPSIPR